jgi:hypothetical protein
MANMSTQGDSYLAHPFEGDPRWLLIQRIAASSGFVNAHRLTAFLRYVVKQSLAGQGANLNERSIGEVVFGRSREYDPRDDNIVRSHASRLRSRLEAYFEAEGAAEQWRVYIPRGNYIPVFEEIGPAPRPAAIPFFLPESAHVPQQPHTAPRPARLWPRVLRLVASCLVLLAGAIGVASAFSYLRQRTSLADTPSHQLWSQLFRSNQQTIIVPADSNLVIAQLMVGHPISLHDYAGGNYRQALDCVKPCDPAVLRAVESSRYTSMSDLEFAVKMSHLPEAIPNRTEIGFARDLELKDFKESNLILAGSQESDPWIGVISGAMNFVIHDRSSAGAERVENRQPKPGEKSEYLYDTHDPQHRGLATIAFLPNLSGSGNMLVVQGFTGAGTQAAAEFVTSGKDLDTLLRPYTRKDSRLPHFEILLSTTEVNGMASRSVPVALHIDP